MKWKIRLSYLSMLSLAFALWIAPKECWSHIAPPPECDEFITGGGFILINCSGKTEKANFGIQGGLKNGSFWGGLNYQDHCTKMHVKSTAVTSYGVVNATTRVIHYNVTINGVAGTAEVVVSDQGEPGTNDTFRIHLSNGYFAQGTLTGGNIQLHKQKCN